MHSAFPPTLLLSSAPLETVAPLLLSRKCLCPTDGIFQDCEKRVLQGEADLWNSCDTTVSFLMNETEVAEIVCFVKSGAPVSYKPLCVHRSRSPGNLDRPR